MKINIRVLALLFAGIIACQEDEQTPTACYECAMTVKTTANGTTDTASSRTNTCGWTAEDAKQAESAGTSTTTSTSGGVTVTITYKTICGKTGN